MRSITVSSVDIMNKHTKRENDKMRESERSVIISDFGEK